MKAGRSLELIQFDIQGAAEVASEDLPFVSMGSGQMTADPFLAFQRRVFWLDAAPSIERGCLTAIWTIQHAIQVSPGGVGEHIDVAVLTEDNGVPTARQLEAEQLLELRQHIADAEAALGRFARGEEPEPAAAPAPTPEA